jgi:hypothetical protein
MLNFVKRDEQWIAAAQEVFNIQQKIKVMESQEAILIEKLKAITGELNSIGGGFKFETIMRKGSVEYNNIPQLKGVDLERYRKASSFYWKLSYVGEIVEEML